MIILFGLVGGSGCGGEGQADPAGVTDCLERVGAEVSEGYDDQWANLVPGGAEHVLEVLMPATSSGTPGGHVAVIFAGSEEGARQVEERVKTLSPKGGELVRRKGTIAYVWDEAGSPSQPSASAWKLIEECV